MARWWSPSRKTRALLWRKPGVIVAEQSLLDRLGVGIGGTLSIGDATVTIGGVLGTQPDRLADRLAYGPRVLMSLETLDRTGLIQPGSLIRWIYRLKLPEPRGNDKTALNTTRFTIEAKFPESGFAINDWTDPAPSIRREVKRFTQFISLVGLTALLAWRHRRRQRHRQLHGEEARRHRHLQDARRLEQARAFRLSDPGAHARRDRHRHRPHPRRADPCAPLRHLWRGAAHRARGRAASHVAPHRGRRGPPHHAALRASAAWPRQASCRPRC